MESASGEPRWPAFTRTPYSYPGSLFTVLEARSRRPFGAWPRRVAVRRRRTLIFGRRTSTERLAAAPRPHRVPRLLARHRPSPIARAGLMMVARPRPAPHDNKSALLLEQSVVRGAPPGRATATRTEAPGNRLRPQANLPRYAPDDVPSLRP